MDKRVLILGNGISRLLFHAEIEAWPDEVWGCNFAYQEYPHELTRLSGHGVNMPDAVKYAEEHGHNYSIYAGNLGRCPCESVSFTCPPELRKDSGTTLVAQALHEGYRVSCTGFDMGGRDIGSRNHHTKAKHNWIRRWQALYHVYNRLEAVEFWGHDHKPIIASSDGNAVVEYGRMYRDNKPHLDDDEYRALYFLFFGVSEYPAKRTELVQCRMLTEKRAGQFRMVHAWVALAEAESGKLEILEDVPRMTVSEATVEAVLEKVPERILYVMGVRHGLSKESMDGMDKRTLMREIGRADG